MSYDLDFWKYDNDIPSNNHQTVYERLSNGELVEGLQNIPLEQILKAVMNLFSSLGWIQIDDHTWERAEGMFQIYTTPQFFRVDCYGMKGEEMNHFIDIAKKFGLPLYDPQVGERFDG